jgi:hypothetical protein
MSVVREAGEGRAGSAPGSPGASWRAVALLAAAVVLAWSDLAAALNEEFEVPKEEPGTTYTRRWNWCHARDPYYSTTQHADPAEPRLDESREPDRERPYIYMGAATASFAGLLPGRYEVWVFYRKSTNRTEWVPWEITTDGVGRSHAAGHVNQYEDVGCCGEWYLLEETRAAPLDVRGTLTLAWSRDEGDYPEYDARSVAYGGARVVRIALSAVATPTIAPDGGTFDGPVTVTLATATAGATIRYTTDGGTATAASPAYGAPFVLTASATVRARAFAPEMTDSEEASAAFTIRPGGEDGGDGGGGDADAAGEADGGAEDAASEGDAAVRDAPDAGGCGAATCDETCRAGGFGRGDCRGDLCVCSADDAPLAEGCGCGIPGRLPAAALAALLAALVVGRLVSRRGPRRP